MCTDLRHLRGHDLSKKQTSEIIVLIHNIIYFQLVIKVWIRNLIDSQENGAF